MKHLKEGEEVVALGGTYKGLDTALVVRTAWSGNFFAKFEVLEIIAKPRRTWIRLPEYEQGGWRGDLDQYYRPIQASALKTRETRSRKIAPRRSTHATTLPQEK